MSSGLPQGLVQDGLLEAARHTPDRIALIAGEQGISFHQLIKRAGVFAAGVLPLLKSGTSPRVALCLPNSPVVVDVFFGTLLAGGCVCLFDPGWPRSLLVDLLNDHQPDVLVAPDDLLADIKDELGSTTGVPLSELENLEADDKGYALNIPSTSPDSSFLIGFTSGSSGKPKAFIRSHQTWIESFRHSAEEFGTSDGDVVFAPGPLSHGLSLYAVIEALCAGATAIIQTKFSAPDVLEALDQRSVSTLVVVPAMLDAILEHGRGQSHSALKRIVTAGAKLSPSLRARAADVFPSAETVEYYGASELSFITVAKGGEAVPPESVGRAFSGVAVSVRDETGQDVTVGDVGTVWIKSDMVCNGYVGFTDGSGLRTHQGWSTVGDIGHLDAEGFLYLAGREGSAITSAGYTVYPSAIENALLRHPVVSDAAVVGLPHAKWGEVIAAVVVPKSGQRLSEADLVAHCSEALEPYACPREWRITDVLERTQSGKVKRSVLLALFSASST